MEHGIRMAPSTFEPGTQYQDNAIARMAKMLPPTERVKLKEKKQGKKITIPDEVVLGIRRHAEVDRWSFPRIQAKYPDYSVRWLRQIIAYELRANLQLK